jgi:hypothetical protein
MNYACPTRESTIDTHLLQLQLLQYSVLSGSGNCVSITLARALHVPFKISCVYNYITKLRSHESSKIIRI